MKIRAFIFISVFCGVQTTVLSGQSNERFLVPKVDQRVELVSIACRLANINGFTDDLNPKYTSDINAHFAIYRNHPFIQLLKKQKSKLDEMYWEIPAVAVHLSQPPMLKPLIAFDDTTNADDWESRALFNEQFVGLLQRFYTEAKCEQFFQSQELYYKQVSQHYEKKGVKMNKQWVDNFFGLTPTENYYPIVALGMRNGAYMRVNSKNNQRNTFTIFECTSFDKNGLPDMFASSNFPRLMLHEYIHAFSNQLVDKNMAELQPAAEAILKNPKVFGLVKDTFYGNWQYLLYESLVRVCSIKYFEANNEIGTTKEKEIDTQEKAGFLWMRNLVKELDNYETNRKKYKNMSDYMPRLIAFFKSTQREIEK